MLAGGRKLALPLLVLGAPFAVIALATTSSLLTPPCSLADPTSAGASPGGWITTGATIDPTYGGGAYPQYYNQGLSYAELGATPGYPNYARGLLTHALGIQGGPEGLPGGFALLARPVGSDSPGIRILKSDVGSGQAGNPHYTIDLHPRIAQLLGFDGKQDIQIKAAGNHPGLNPQYAADDSTSPDCEPSTTALTLTPGERARILPDGTAAAPQDAPTQVKLAIAAANQIHTKPYSINPDGAAQHYGPLSQPWPAYDCSGTVSYVLYQAGLHSVQADVSGNLETWGQPGPGTWITVYANPTHTWITIAGLAFDTANYGGPNIPTGTGPRWRQNPTGNLQDGMRYAIRHPAGL